MVKAGITGQEQRFMGKFFLYFSFAMGVLVGGSLLFQLVWARLLAEPLALALPFPILVVPLGWILTGIALIRLAPRRQQLEDCRQAAARGPLLLSWLSINRFPTLRRCCSPVPFAWSPAGGSVGPSVRAAGCSSSSLCSSCPMSWGRGSSS
jgi:hypothetical protein